MSNKHTKDIINSIVDELVSVHAMPCGSAVWSPKRKGSLRIIYELRLLP